MHPEWLQLDPARKEELTSHRLDNGQTILHWLLQRTTLPAFADRQWVIRALYYFRRLVNVADSAGVTPLSMAVRIGDEGLRDLIVSELVQMKAGLTQPDSRGVSPYQYWVALHRNRPFPCPSAPGVDGGVFLCVEEAWDGVRGHRDLARAGDLLRSPGTLRMRDPITGKTAMHHLCACIAREVEGNEFIAPMALEIFRRAVAACPENAADPDIVRTFMVFPEKLREAAGDVIPKASCDGMDIHGGSKPPAVMAVVDVQHGIDPAVMRVATPPGAGPAASGAEHQDRAKEGSVEDAGTPRVVGGPRTVKAAAGRAKRGSDGATEGSELAKDGLDEVNSVSDVVKSPSHGFTEGSGAAEQESGGNGVALKKGNRPPSQAVEDGPAMDANRAEGSAGGDRGILESDGEDGRILGSVAASAHAPTPAHSCIDPGAPQPSIEETMDTRVSDTKNATEETRGEAAADRVEPADSAGLGAEGAADEAPAGSDINTARGGDDGDDGDGYPACGHCAAEFTPLLEGQSLCTGCLAYQHVNGCLETRRCVVCVCTQCPVPATADEMKAAVTRLAMEATESEGGVQALGEAASPAPGRAPSQQEQPQHRNSDGGAAQTAGVTQRWGPGCDHCDRPTPPGHIYCAGCASFKAKGRRLSERVCMVCGDHRLKMYRRGGNIFQKTGGRLLCTDCHLPGTTITPKQPRTPPHTPPLLQQFSDDRPRRAPVSPVSPAETLPRHSPSPSVRGSAPAVTNANAAVRMLRKRLMEAETRLGEVTRQHGEVEQRLEKVSGKLKSTLVASNNMRAEKELQSERLARAEQQVTELRECLMRSKGAETQQEGRSEASDADTSADDCSVGSDWTEVPVSKKPRIECEEPRIECV